MLSVCISISKASPEIGFVVTPDSHATKIAKEILSKGGNAVDAGIAAMFALTVVEPFSTGLGGGGLLIVHMKDKNETSVIDFREAARGVDKVGPALKYCLELSFSLYYFVLDIEFDGESKR